MSATQPDISQQTSWRRFFKFLTFREIIFTAFVFIIEIGCDLSLDTPGALQNSMIKNYNLSSSQFSLFYSLYYVPSIALNGIGGFLIDKSMGIKISTIVYSLIGIVGVTLFSVGGVTNLFWLMLLGRLIFGLGNEMATGVCINYCIFAWYRNTVMNVAASLVSDGGMVGTLILYQVAPRFLVYLKNFMPEKEALDIVVSTASGTFLVTVGFTVLLTHLKPKERTEENSRVESSLSNSRLSIEERKPSFKDILLFPLIYWVMCFLNIIYCSIGVFYEFSQQILTSDEFRMTLDEANNAVTLMGTVNAVLTLPLSFTVDKFGRNTWYIISSSSFAVVAYFLFSLRVNPYFVLFLLGISKALFNSSYLPMFGYLVEKHVIGTCYGIASVTTGVSTSLSPLLMGLVIDRFYVGGAIYFLLSASVLSLLCILLILFLDKRSTGILCMTPQQRIEYERSIGSNLEPSRISSSFGSMSTVLTLLDAQSPEGIYDETYSLSLAY